jgi:magnesium chelatase family protein
MTGAKALDPMRLHRIAGLTGDHTALVTTRPFRAPHHTISDVGLIGGGQIPLPGEMSLAHHGVLFLDELPEFRRHVLEVLRQPLEDGVVTIARAAVSVTFPARLTLVGAMNACPCGQRGHPEKPLWSAKNPSSGQITGCESALDDNLPTCDNSREASQRWRHSRTGSAI